MYLLVQTLGWSLARTFSFIFPILFPKGTFLKWCPLYSLWLMSISIAGDPKMSIGVTRFGFWAKRIPNISDGHPSAFLYDVFSA